MATYHGINQFDTIVISWVVAGCDHDSNGRVALLGANSRDQSNCVHDMVKARIATTPLLLVQILMMGAEGKEDGGPCQLGAAEGLHTLSCETEARRANS